MSKKPQTKIARVQGMLEKPKGASLAAICKATGWQAHSARAILSGLRKSGYSIERNPGSSGSVYRIIGSPETTG